MAKNGRPSRVILKGDPIYKERRLKAPDAYGVGVIQPGMLVEYTNDEIQPHSSAAGFASKLFAVENPIRDGMTIEDLYSTDDETVLYAACRPGDEVFVLIEPGANISNNALLQSGGQGYLQAGATNAVVRAIEALNNSAGSTAVHIRAEVL